MSGLEIVASIAGVASAAIKISMTMNEFADELGSAGRDVRYISNDMASFAQVLRLVHTSLSDSLKATNTPVIQKALETMPQLVSQCDKVHEEANGLMLAFSPAATKDKSNSMPFFKRVKFLFQKSRVTVLRSLLDSSKSTLNLLLVTLNIEMTKSKGGGQDMMDQLQSERRVFIRVVHSQSKALEEALKEVEKAKKETAKLKTKAEKEKQKAEKEKEKQAQKEKSESKTNLEPPPIYSLQAPSVSQLVYTPPAIDNNLQDAVMTLALSLGPPEPPPAPKQEPAVNESPFENYIPHGTFNHQYDAPQSFPVPPPYFDTSFPQPPRPPQPTKSPRFAQAPQFSPPQANANKPGPGKRVFSDPGPAKPTTSSVENLHPGAPPQERSRSPYSFSRVPNDDPPEVERSRAPYSSQSPTQPNSPKNEIPNQENSKPEAERKRTPYSFQQPQREQNATPQNPPKYKAYQPPPPPLPPRPPTEHPSPQSSSPQAERRRSSYGNNNASNPPQPQGQRRKPVAPPPTPVHGTTYISLASYTSREIGHLTLSPFDTLVDLMSYTPEEEALPYPTAHDAKDGQTPQHYWQASLHHRRGPRGLFPCHVVCPIDDERVDSKMKQFWFGSAGVGLIADGHGRVWTGPEWNFQEPVRRRSKWWDKEF